MINFILLLVGINLHAQTTTMENYLEQVRQKDPAYKASVDSSEGARMRSTEGDLLVLPTFGAEFSRREDYSPTAIPQLYGTERTNNVYQFYLQEQTTFGLNAKLAYGDNFSSTAGSNFALPGVTPGPTDYYTASPSITLTQNLWRNGFGNETRATEDMLNARAKETYYLNKNKNIGVLTEAQMAYYRMYYAKASLDAIKSSLNVASQLLNWAKSRLNKGLGENSDYLQTKANYELRQLDLSSAEEELRSAGRSFNSLRGVDSEVVSEELKNPGLPEYKGATSLSDNKWRADVRAAQKNLEAAKANSLIGREKNKPSLDLSGSYAYNSLDTSHSQAVSDSFQNTYPTWMIDLKFTVPLWLEKSSDVRNGYEKEAFAADLEFKRKSEEQVRDFNDLQSKIKNAYTRLELSKTLEGSQKSKAEEERKRHQRGRTTFFQVLTFEQDYLTSELARIKTENELSGYLIQLQKYREE